MAFPAEKHREIMICENDRKTIPAPFISKTYQLVDDPRSNHIVSWGEHDATFIVWRPPEFARDILPSYFKHNNFSSFVRQLNTYGFRKVVACRWEFANEFFKKGQKHLLCDVQRRKTASSDHQIYQSQCYSSLERRQRSSNDLEDSTWTNVNLPQTSQYNHDYNGYLLAALEDNQRLRKKNILLLSELTQMKRLYNDIMFYIQNRANMNTNCKICKEENRDNVK